MAVRVPGVNLFIAADRIRLRSSCRKALSGPARESGISSACGVSSFPLESSIDTSRGPRPLRRNMRASLMAIRVNQVEKQDFPSNLCKWTKAFWKLCCAMSSASSSIRVKRGRRRHPAARGRPTPSLAMWISGTRAKSPSPGRLLCEIRHEPWLKKLLERPESCAFV